MPIAIIRGRTRTQFVSVEEVDSSVAFGSRQKSDGVASGGAPADVGRRAPARWGGAGAGGRF